MTVLNPCEAYRRWAPNYDNENAVTSLECGLVAMISPSPANKRLLDVGCGTGRRLVDTGASIAIGIEPCAEMLETGLKTHQFGSEVQFISGDACALPVGDCSADLTWCRLVIGHIANFGTAISELARATTPGGTVIVTDFHPDAVAAGMRRTFRDCDEVFEVEHHVHAAEAQIEEAARAGLSLVAMEQAKIGPEVRHFFAAANRLDVYRANLELPIVLALKFSRDG